MCMCVAHECDACMNMIVHVSMCMPVYTSTCTTLYIDVYR